LKIIIENMIYEGKVLNPFLSQETEEPEIPAVPEGEEGAEEGEDETSFE
jgi:hypothetical protein